MKIRVIACAVACALACSSHVTLPASAGDATIPPRPVHTFSIVARDPSTGQMGVAVQSHWFSVGPTVPWAEAGVGAVATQSFVRIDYGPEGLALMKKGVAAPEALKRLLSADEGRDVRQVAMIDASGRVAAHTGAKCIQAAGHHVGIDYSVQANLMLDAGVWPVLRGASWPSAWSLRSRRRRPRAGTSAGGSPPPFSSSRGPAAPDPGRTRSSS